VRRSRRLVVRVIDGWLATKMLTDSYWRMALIT
jgi:hypothetical protein